MELQLERSRYPEFQPAITQTPSNLGPAPEAPSWSSWNQLQQHSSTPATTRPLHIQRPHDPLQTTHIPEVLASTAITSQDAQSGDSTAQKELLKYLEAAESDIINAFHQLILRTCNVDQQERALPLQITPCTSTSTTAEASTSATLQEPTNSKLTARKALLNHLVAACDATTNPFADNNEDMQQIVPDGDGSTLRSLRSKADILALQLAASHASDSDCQLIRSFSSVLGCTDRLQAIYRDSPGLADADCSQLQDRSSTAGDMLTSQNDLSTVKSYHLLQKHARTLQSSRLLRQDSQQSSSSLSAVRAVEEAELDLLWGRLDDLLSDIANADKIPMVLAENSSDTNALRSMDMRTGIDYHLFGPTPAMASDASIFTSHHHLPEYASLDPPEYEYEGLDEKQPTERFDEHPDDFDVVAPRRQQRRVSASDEKMQSDLDRMTAAIERLHVASPQLANQRVEAISRSLNGSANKSIQIDRLQLREMQLAKLGTAIERLSKGRLEEQRAVLGTSETLGHINGSSTKAGKERQAENMQRSLDALLDSIDRAASRTMSDQRVSLTPRHGKAISDARTTARLAAEGLRNRQDAHTDIKTSSFSALDADERAFREQLLDEVGKGRLTSQDASFTHNRTSHPGKSNLQPTLLSMKRRSHAHVFDNEEDASAMRRSNSRGRAHTLDGDFNTMPDQVGHSHDKGQQQGQASNTVKKRFSVTRLLSGSKEALGSTMSRSRSRTSPSASRPPSVHGEPPMQLAWVVEEMRNLSSLIVRAWVEKHAGDSHQDGLPANGTSESWSAVLADASTLQLRSEATGGDLQTIKLAVPATRLVKQSKSMDLVFKHDHYELRLPTSEAAQPTRIRSDLEFIPPYSALDFRTHRPATLACVECAAQLADLSRVSKYNDLPSEHWAELLDAWMCHQDQSLSAELIAKGNNIWPRPDQALFRSDGVILDACNTMCLKTDHDIEPVDRPEGRWAFVRCSLCNALVGSACLERVGRSDVTPTAPPSFTYLWKYAVKPPISALMPSQSLSSHVTAHLLETSLAKASHHFIVEDRENSTIRLVIWLFNPFVRISSSSLASPITTCKILYHVAPGGWNNSSAEQLIGKAEYSNYILPARICKVLSDTLERSTLIHPPSQRKLGEWSVGWLERSERRS